MSEGEMRGCIRAALQSLNADTEAAIRRELATPIDLDDSERLQFEACPHFFGIKLVQTEEEIVPDSTILATIPEDLQAAAACADLDVHAAIESELPPWLADRWLAAGGPILYRPAYMLFHGGLDEPRYDLEQRRWCEVLEVWPDEHEA
jgi:hypothetical protein